MKKHTKDAMTDLTWTFVTCGIYFVVIFLRVLFTSKEGQKLVEEKIDKKIKAAKAAKIKGFKVKAKKGKKAVVTWKKAKGVSGYQLMRSNKKKGKSSCGCDCGHCAQSCGRKQV